MNLIDRKSALWGYLTDDIKGLIVDGEYLVSHAERDHRRVSDFSYLVFPFSKAYEGFLKKLFLDLDLIKEDEYYGEEIRIGRILNPHYKRSKKNVFNRLCRHVDGEKSVAERMWETWRKGRNQVFHYFPHNFRKLSYKEAREIIEELLDVMDDAVMGCGLTEV
jgi:hypothetical protein